MKSTDLRLTIIVGLVCALAAGLSANSSHASYDEFESCVYGPGDNNDDGSTNVLDVVRAVQLVLGTIVFEENDILDQYSLCNECHDDTYPDAWVAGWTSVALEAPSESPDIPSYGIVTPCEMRPGDVDQEHHVNVTDIVALVSFILGTNPADCTSEPYPDGCNTASIFLSKPSACYDCHEDTYTAAFSTGLCAACTSNAGQSSKAPECQECFPCTNCPGSPYPNWVLEDLQPGTEENPNPMLNEIYGLDHFMNNPDAESKVTVVALLAGY